jgi:hypothetical protein
MITQIKKQKEVVSELVRFFNSQGVEITTSESKRDVVLNLFDRRSEDIFITYSLRLIDGGDKVEVFSFQVTTPKLQFVLSDNMIEVFVTSPMLKRTHFSLTWRSRIPSILQIDYTLLRSLLENPVSFLLNLKLHENGHIYPTFLKMLKDYSNECRFPLSIDQSETITSTIHSLRKQTLNSTALLL